MQYLYYHPQANCVGQLGSIRLPAVRQPIPDEEDKNTINLCKVPFTQHDGLQWPLHFGPLWDHRARWIQWSESRHGYRPSKTKFLQVTGVDKRTAQRRLVYHILLQIHAAMWSWTWRENATWQPSDNRFHFFKLMAFKGDLDLMCVGVCVCVSAWARVRFPKPLKKDSIFWTFKNPHGKVLGLYLTPWPYFCEAKSFLMCWIWKFFTVNIHDFKNNGFALS